MTARRKLKPYNGCSARGDCTLGAAIVAAPADKAPLPVSSWPQPADVAEPQKVAA